MYDPEARTGKKREVTWLGYKVHLTETCAVDATQDAQAKAMPQFIVEVQTSVANLQDVEATALIQEDLAQHELLPEDQIVDTGYVDAELLLSSQEQYGIRLLGPVLSDTRAVYASIELCDSIDTRHGARRIFCQAQEI